jgi:alpha-glucosidase (family GH31 glycosyl hydrolase)
MTLHQRSIEIIRAGQAASGAYIASPTFSQYGYAWLRDGSWVAYAMDCIGQHDSARAFYEWVGRTVLRQEGRVDALLAKLERGETPAEQDYLPTRFTLEGEADGEFWWDFQLDGYGTWLWGLAQHVQLTDNQALWDSLLSAIRLTVRYLEALWQSSNYDCWEEHREQIHPATLAAIYGGLRAVQEIDPSLVPASLPEKIRAYVLENAIAPEGHVMKFLGNSEVDASLLWTSLPYGLLSVDDDIFQKTVAKIEEDLHVPGGGVYRYRQDTYYGGGEWILLTAWLGWAYVERGRGYKAVSLLRWIEAQANADFHLPEQVEDNLLDASYLSHWQEKWGLSASPLLWSHAMYLILQSKLLQIIHEPYGLEHPYEQGAEERTPRDPLAEERFRIGIVTRPVGAAQTVNVHTRVDDGEVEIIPAVLQVDWQARQEEGVGAEFLERIVRVEQDVWQAELIAPPHGQTLIYGLEADGLLGREYTLRGAAWKTTDAAITVTTDADGIYRMQVGRGGNGASSVPNLPGLQKVEWLTDGERAQKVRLTFAAAPDERFYGFGERYNALDQRGNVLDVRCYEQYKNQGQRTYMPIPFMLSSQPYGVWVESARWMQFDLTEENSWSVEAELPPNEELHLSWFTGDDPYEIVSAFTRLTGPTVLPPEWAFGLWMSSNEWNSQERVMAEVAQHEQHNIPVSVLVIEAWSDETTFYIWNDAEYSPRAGDDFPRLADFKFGGKWPDPHGMIQALHEKGIRLLLWQIPTFKYIEEAYPQHEADKAVFEAGTFGVQEADGSLYKVRPFWFRDGYLLDVTNPAALNWWFGKRAYLLTEMGIDGFKTDGGEHLWGSRTRFADGRTGAELWNEYPLLYTEAYYNFATEKKNGDAMTFSRAGFTGSQRAPAHWAGDENSTWDAYRHSILAGLSAGISGISFWSWDLAGFSGEIPDAELYLRGAAMAVFCPIMQYHSEYNPQRDPSRDRTPWNIEARTGQQVIESFRSLVELRERLRPYLWEEAQYSAGTGIPMMRALQVIDPNASPYQYFLGRDLLICPVVEAGVTEWDAYLPEGEWVDFWSGELHQGGGIVCVPAPLNQIPVFVRKGAPHLQFSAL